MNQTDEQRRTIQAKIDRLRKRVQDRVADGALRAVLLGFLDLLEDEL